MAGAVLALIAACAAPAAARAASCPHWGRPAVAADPRPHALRVFAIQFEQHPAQIATAADYRNAIDCALRTEVLPHLAPDRPNLVADWASRANEMKGNLNEAMRLSLTEFETQSPGTGALRSAYQRGNWREYQHEKLRFLLSGPAYGCRDYDIGVTYLRLGDAAKAAAHLARGVAESVERSCFWFDSLPVDPILDNLRHEPVYSALLKRANMTP